MERIVITNYRNMRFIKVFTVLVLGALLTVSCRRQSSSSTGWEYNNPKTGGFQKVPFVDQETGPGLLLIEGGTFTMGRTEQDVMYDWNNRARTVSYTHLRAHET